MNEVHLVPKDEEHELDVTCSCKPKVELIPNGARVIHQTKKKFVRYEVWSNEKKNS